MSSLDNIWKDKRLSLSIKLRVYLALVQSVLLYASETWTLNSSRQQVTKRIPHEMPAPYLGNILASIRAERRGCRSHWSLLSVGHHLSPTFSHLWTHSKARRGSACQQGALQLHQPISWTSSGPFLEASSWSSTWQVDRPAPKR